MANTPINEYENFQLQETIKRQLDTFGKQFATLRPVAAAFERALQREQKQKQGRES